MAILDTTIDARIGGSTGRRLHVRTCDASDIPFMLDMPASKANRETLADYRELVEINGPRWYGCKENEDPYQVADTLLRDGWAEGAERAKALAQKIGDVLPPPASIKRRVRWSDEGDELDREKLDRGEVDTMWRTSRRDAVANGPQTIGITFTWGGHAGLTADQLFYSGAACIALSDTLEEAGYNTELFGAWAVNLWGTYQGAHWAAMTHVRVKRAGEGLAQDAIAAMFGHAAVFRCYGIPSTAACPAEIGYGWGSPCPDNVESYLAHAAEHGVIAQNEIVLPLITTEKRAVEVLKDVLARMGEPAEDGA